MSKESKIIAIESEGSSTDPPQSLSVAQRVADTRGETRSVGTSHSPGSAADRPEISPEMGVISATTTS